jgi:acyl carrier protein
LVHAISNPNGSRIKFFIDGCLAVQAKIKSDYPFRSG